MESPEEEEEEMESPEEEEEEMESPEKESPFWSELWRLFPDLPGNSDLFFNKNKHRIIPEGYKVVTVTMVISMML